MKILLTGASGNFGKEFIRQCPDTVVSINRGDWGRLENLMADTEVIIHTASDLHLPFTQHPEAWIQSNIVSTGKILEAAKKFGVARFVFTSSCAVYGDSTKTNEDRACIPTSANGVGKHLNELLISAFCQQNDIDFYILRIFNMYGGNDNFSILSRIRQALRNDDVFVMNNNGTAQRDFVHVRDVVSITRKILESSPAFPTLNIGTGKSTSISTIVDLVKQNYPALRIKHADVAEAEYSRADTQRLRTVTNIEFFPVERFLREEFAL